MYVFLLYFCCRFNKHYTTKKHFNMKNYKITNLKTNVYHLLNEEEKERFLKINNKWFYYTQDIKEVTEIERRKKIENFCFTVIAVLLCVASYLLLCELLNVI